MADELEVDPNKLEITDELIAERRAEHQRARAAGDRARGLHAEGRAFAGEAR